MKVNEIPLNISVNDISVNENAGTAVFTVSLGRASAYGTTVQYSTSNGTATAGSDYTAISGGTVTVPAGSTTANVSVTVNDDADYENGETFYLELSSPSRGTISDAQGVCTILDDDSQPQVVLNVSPAIISENAGTATVTATLSARSYQTVTVNLEVTGMASGTDYSVSGTSISIPPGDLSGNVTVEGIPDSLMENDETITIDVTSVTNAVEQGVQQRTITITDETPVISVGDSQLAEGNSGSANMTFTVTMSKSWNAPITVDYATSDVTATAGSDYATASGTITFAAGDTSRTIAVPVVGDTTIEGNETFLLNLSNESWGIIGDNQATGTIIDDDMSATIACGEGMTEENLNGKELTLTLDGETFIPTLDEGGFTINNAPSGVSIGSVTRNSDAEATLTLSYDGTDFDADVSNFSVTAGAGQLSGGNAITSNSLFVTAVAETAPTVIAGAAAGITSRSASVAGEVTDDGGETVTQRGLAWSTCANPTTADSHTSDGSGTGSFTAALTGLAPGTTYHARAYATNSEGTDYSSDMTFTTSAASANALLSSLASSSGSLSPVFSSAVEAYTASVGYSVSAIKITPTADDAAASIKVNGSAVTSGQASPDISINVGSNSITIEVTAEDGTTAKTYTLNVNRSSYVPPYTPPAPENPTEEKRTVDVEKEDGQTAAKIEINRETEGGVKKDKVELKGEDAQKVLESAEEGEQMSVSMRITEKEGDEADQVEVSLEQDAMQSLGTNGASLTIDTEKVDIELPAQTLASLGDKAELTIKDASSDEQEEATGMILNLAQGSNIISAPVVIETNFSGASRITLPISSEDLPQGEEELKAFIATLAVMVHHSDGEKELLTGTIKYNEKGVPVGITIPIDKYSTFTILELPKGLAGFKGTTNTINYRVMPDKQWKITVNQQIDPETVCDQTVYVMDGNGNECLTKAYAEGNSILIAPAGLYEPDKGYYLYITENVKSKSGSIMDKPARYLFQTSDCGLDGVSLGSRITASSDKKWTIEFNGELDAKTINTSNIYMVDEKGTAVETEIEQTDSQRITVKGKKAYEQGRTYYLFVKGIKAKSGEELSRKAWMKFSLGEGKAYSTSYSGQVSEGASNMAISVE